jgi:nitroreductase
MNLFEAMMARKSTRKFKKRKPSIQSIYKIIEYGIRAPIVAQMYTVILSSKGPHPYDAPISLVFCVDKTRMEKHLKLNGGSLQINDLSILMLGIQEISCMVQNISLAANELGLSTCMIGMCSLYPKRIRYLSMKHSLPYNVLPVLELVVGYSDEYTQQTPRYPMSLNVFEETYRTPSTHDIAKATLKMNKEYQKIKYYSNSQIHISQGDSNFNNVEYTWSEHMKRKWSDKSIKASDISNVLQERGFKITTIEVNDLVSDCL